MKRRTLVSIGILLAMCGTLVGQSVQELFNQALVQERAAGNLEQAIQLYQRVAKGSSTDRALAAQGLLGAARSHQLLGQTVQSKELYAMVVRTYPELSQESAIARANLAETGTVQGTLMRAGTGEPIADAKISLSGGPLDPELRAQFQDGLKQFGINLTVPVYGMSDQKFVQQLTDALSAAGVSIANPAARASLTSFAAANDSRFTATTDSAGRFTMKDVVPGRYTIRSEREGYFPKADSSEPITINAGRVSVVEVSMLRGATVSGRITDASGQPQANVTVQALSVGYESGFPVLRSAVEKTTDEQGEYRLFWLPAGEYLIAALPGERIAARAAGAPVPPGRGRGFAPTTPGVFYPSTHDSSNAIPIFVRGDAPVSGIDILIRNTPAFHITGEIRSHVPSTSTPPPDTLSAGLEIRARHTHTPVNAASTIIGVPLTRSGDHYVGRFDLPQVLPGAYMVTAYMGSEGAAVSAAVNAAAGRGARGPGPRGARGAGGAGGAPNTATTAARGIRGITRADVDVASGDVSGLSLDIYPNVAVRGTVTVDGNAPRQNTVRVSLQADGTLARSGSYVGLAARTGVADGQSGVFAIPNVLAGRFRVDLGAGFPLDLYLADVRQGGVSVFDSGFEVGRDNPSPLQVLLRSGARTVEGMVRDAAGKPVVGATAVLIPPKEARKNRARYYTAKSDASGHFKVQGVAPGDYSLFSWQNMPDGAYFNDRFVSRNEDAGRRVSVGQANAIAANITLIPSIGR